MAERVPSVAAVTETQVQSVVRTEREHAAIVIRPGLGDFEDDGFGCGVRVTRIARRYLVTGDDRAGRVVRGVVHVEVAVGGEVRIEGEAEEAFLSGRRFDPVGDVQEHARARDRVVVREDANPPGLLYYRDAISAVFGGGEEDGLLEGEGGEGRHPLQVGRGPQVGEGQIGDGGPGGQAIGRR